MRCLIKSAVIAIAAHARKKLRCKKWNANMAVKKAIHDVKQKPQNNGLRAITERRFRIPSFNAGKVFKVSFHMSDMKATSELMANRLKNMMIVLMNGKWDRAERYFPGAIDQPATTAGYDSATVAISLSIWVPERIPPNWAESGWSFPSNCIKGVCAASTTIAAALTQLYSIAVRTTTNDPFGLTFCV